MNEEFKITMPSITETELTKIDNNLHEIVNEFIKMAVKDKELLFSQHIIKRLEEENQRLKEELDAHSKGLCECVNEKNRIQDKKDKAIYYLENLKNYHIVSEIRDEKIELYATLENFVHDLLEILKERSDK